MSPLVSPDWLAARLDDTSLVLLEVAFKLPGEAAWHEGHIPGSRYVYWKDLCWDETAREFPDPDTMAARLGALGADDSKTIVLIGDTIQFATYAYWVMAMTGLEHLAVVLDGGHQTWEARGLPMTQDEPAPARPGTVTPALPDKSSRIGRDEVLSHLGDPDRTLIDLRSDEEYRGLRVAPTTAPYDHGAERGGHIPGAAHLYYERLLRDDGTFRPGEDIAAEFIAEGAGPERDTVTYCRLSHRASLGWFALTRLNDWKRVRVYDGSWTEWGSMVGMPVER